jgi:hypothetical protein
MHKESTRLMSRLIQSTPQYRLACHSLPPQHTLVCSSYLVSCRRLHPLVRQELVLSRPSVLDLDAVCTQRASLGIMLYMDTAERGAVYAKRNLFVRIRYSM